MSLNDYQFANLAPEQKLELVARQISSAIGLLNEEITAAVIGVEPSTLATWRSQGKGPDYVKLGKGVFYTANALAAWVNGEMARQREERRAA
jgi:hypothetical protein